MKLTDAEMADTVCECYACAQGRLLLRRRAQWVCDENELNEQLKARIAALVAECDQWKLGSATVNGRLLERIAELEARIAEFEAALTWQHDAAATSFIDEIARALGWTRDGPEEIVNLNEIRDEVLHWLEVAKSTADGEAKS